MNYCKRLLALTLLIVALLTNHQSAYAVKCSICTDDHLDPNDAAAAVIACINGHAAHRDCVTDAVKSHGDLGSLAKHGLPCCGENCQQKFPLDQILGLLKPIDKLALEDRIAKTRAKSPIDESRAKEETKRITEGVEESFNLCCPVDGCGSTLDQVEGCNAAKCSNEECKTTFCYLCFKPQKDSQTAHAHIRDQHSGNYWELRPGYVDRYHWLQTRKKLANLFERKIDETVRANALSARKALLQGKKMWPMPAGLMSSRWIKELAESALTREQKIEFLQNEYIYRSHAADSKNAEVIKAELERLGGRVLASLDVRDAAGLNPAAPAVVQRNAPQAVAGPGPAQGAAAVNQPGGIGLEPVEHDDARVTRAFADLGNMYLVTDPRPPANPAQRVAPFILSGVAPNTMNHANAIAFCRGLGAELPTKSQLEALSRAMGTGAPQGYDRNRIPEMDGRMFWSASVHPGYGDYAFYLDGGNGNVVNVSRNYVRGSVRCVR